MVFKKVMAATLSLTMVGAVFASCGGSDDSSSKKDDSSKKTTAATTTAAATTTTAAATTTAAETTAFKLADGALVAYISGGTDGFQTSTFWWDSKDNTTEASVLPEESYITPVSVTGDGEYTTSVHLSADPDALEFQVLGVYLEFTDDIAAKVKMTDDMTKDQLPVVMDLVKLTIDGKEVAYDDSKALKYSQDKGKKLSLELANLYNPDKDTLDKITVMPTSDIEITFKVSGLDQFMK